MYTERWLMIHSAKIEQNNKLGKYSPNIFIN